MTQAQLRDISSWIDGQELDQSLPLDPTKTSIDSLRLARELTAHYCRDRHNEWSAEWITENLSSFGFWKYPDWTDDLKILCDSHHRDYTDLIKANFDVRLVGGEVVSLRYLAATLRMADILDIDVERAPAIILRQRAVEDSSLIFWYKDAALNLQVAAPSIIAHARPTSAALHHAIEETIDSIDREITTCVLLNANKPFNVIPGQNHVPHRTWLLSSRVQRNVLPKEDSYEYIDGAFRPNTRKLLQLLSGRELYRSELEAIRELVQNAFDAVKTQIAYEVLEANEAASLALLEKIAAVQYVELRVEEQGSDIWLVCEDSGVGMSKRIISEHLLVSGQKPRADLRDLARRSHAAGLELQLTSQFGIGALSYFMLADYVQIRTFRSQLTGDGAIERSGWLFTTEGVGSFGELRRDSNRKRGTEVRLRLRKDLPERTRDYIRDELVNFVERKIRKTPCSLRIRRASKLIKQYDPGWLRQENMLKQRIATEFKIDQADSGELPRDLLPKRALKRIAEGEAEESKVRTDLLKCLRLHSFTGDLKSGLGSYKIEIPYFEIDGKRSCCYMCVDDSGHLTKIGNGNFFYPNGLLQQSWRGFEFAPTHVRESSFKGAFVQIDWTSEDSGTISVDRSSFQRSPVTKSAFDEIESKIREARIAVFLTENSKFTYLNRRLSTIEANSQDCWWAIERKGKLSLEKIEGPFTISSPFTYSRSPDKFLWDRGEFPVIFPLRGISDDDYYDGLTIVSARSLPDRIVFSKDTGTHLVPLFTKIPLHFEATRFVKATFPPEWHEIVGVRFAHFAGSEGVASPAIIWNRNAPMVSDLSEEAWLWAENKFEQKIDPRLYWAELSQKTKAAAWMLNVLAGKRSKIWQGLAEHLQTELSELWSIHLAAYDKLAFWREDRYSSIWHSISVKGWNEVDSERGSTPVPMLPSTSPEWQVEFRYDSSRS